MLTGAWPRHDALHAVHPVVAATGCATFLTWPIWIGPLALLLAIVVLKNAALTGRQRARHLTMAMALAPIAIVGAIYASARQVYAFGMVNAVGFAVDGTKTRGFVQVTVGTPDA